MNHKWNDNICVQCGIMRSKRERQTISYTYSKLGRDGIFYDVPVWTINYHYAYSLDGNVWLFERPDCKLVPVAPNP